MSSPTETPAGQLDVAQFNELDTNAAVVLLRSCLAVPRWIDALIDDGPYISSAELRAHASELAATLTSAEVALALARHPRIGERAGSGHDGDFSAREQAAPSDADLSTADAIRQGNEEYERRYNRVFLIRAAGRSPTEILAELHRRLRNPPEVEEREVIAQLGEIAVLRLTHLVADHTPAGPVAPGSRWR